MPLSGTEIKQMYIIYNGEAEGMFLGNSKWP